MDPRLDPRLRDEEGEDEDERRDQEAVLVVLEDQGHEHPPGEGDRRVTRRPAAPQRRPAVRERLHRDHEDARQEQRDEGDVRRRVRDPVEQPGAPVTDLLGEDEVPDGDRVDRRDEDGTRRDVLRELRIRVERRRRDVDHPRSPC